MILRPKEMNLRTFEPQHRGISDFTTCEAIDLPFRHLSSEMKVMGHKRWPGKVASWGLTESASNTNYGVPLSTAGYDVDQPCRRGGVEEERAGGTGKTEKGQQSTVVLHRQK